MISSLNSTPVRLPAVAEKSQPTQDKPVESGDHYEGGGGWGVGAWGRPMLTGAVGAVAGAAVLGVTGATLATTTGMAVAAAAAGVVVGGGVGLFAGLTYGLLHD